MVGYVRTADEIEKQRLMDAAQMAQTTPLVGRIAVRFFARPFNRIASRILFRAYERGEITSRQLHVLARQFDPTQAGVVGILRGRK